MFLLKKPSEDEIKKFISEERVRPFSYPEVGATALDLPAGYTVDHNRVKLGIGDEIFRRAVSALEHWKQFDLGWVQIVPAGTPIEVGSVVAILTSHFGFWSLNACRVVYLINDKAGPVQLFGFAYGTLSSHVERGEEKFTIERHEDGSVWYDILAFSRPNKILVKMGRFAARRMQKRFARDSLAAMLSASKI